VDGGYGAEGIHDPAGLAAVSQFEREHGAFTADELAEAGQWAANAVERAQRTGGSQHRSA
jgi:hypothetical protein